MQHAGLPIQGTYGAGVPGAHCRVISPRPPYAQVIAMADKVRCEKCGAPTSRRDDGEYHPFCLRCLRREEKRLRNLKKAKVTRCGRNTKP